MARSENAGKADEITAAHPVVQAAAEAIRNAAPSGPVDGLSVHAIGTPEAMAAVVAPAVLRAFAADVRSWVTPGSTGVPNSAFYRGAYAAANEAEKQAAEIERASDSPEGDTR